jgi:hypothetical protein
MATSHATLKFFRQIHLYIGIFTAPALLFFALTGALQTFSLHETSRGSDYKPPTWIVALSQLHKKQTATLPVRKPRPTSDSPRPDKHAAEADAFKPARNPDAPGAVTPSVATPSAATPSAVTPEPVQKNHIPMKIFFLIVSIGLFLSTLTGIYMAYKFNRSKVLITGLLLAGIIVPLLLLPF